MNHRVLFLTPGLTKGGAETQLIKVATFLRTQNREVLILALKPLNDFNLDGLNVIFLENWKKKPISNVIKIYRTFKTYRPTVVVAFMFAAILVARALKLSSKFTLVSTIRTPVLGKKWYAAFKSTAKLDDIVVYNSKSSKTVFEENNLCKKNGIIINNAISVPVSIRATTSTQPLFVWCCVAHFRPAKDYQTLFKAIALIKDQNFRVDILGHLSNQTWPKEMIEALQIDDKVRLLGFKRNVSEYLDDAHSFVLSTNWEGSPNAVLEAMSYGKPVVASAVLGIEDIINNAKCGFLFKCGDEVQLAKKMTEIMSMPDVKRNELGARGRKFVEQYYSEESVMKQWDSVIYSTGQVEMEVSI